MLDLILLQKDESGRCYRSEISDLPPEQAAVLNLIEAEFGGFFDGAGTYQTGQFFVMDGGWAFE